MARTYQALSLVELHHVVLDELVLAGGPDLALEASGGRAVVLELNDDTLAEAVLGESDAAE